MIDHLNHKALLISSLDIPVKGQAGRAGVEAKSNRTDQ